MSAGAELPVDLVAALDGLEALPGGTRARALVERYVATGEEQARLDAVLAIAEIVQADPSGGAA